MTKAHTGVYLGEKLTECLKEYGIERKILSVICDNTSNNGPMIETMEKLVPTFAGDEYCVMCFGDILNLVVKAIHSQFLHSQKATSDTNEDRQDENALNEINDPDDEDDVAAREDVNSDLKVSDAQILDEQGDEVELDTLKLGKLTWAQVNLSHFSILKMLGQAIPMKSVLDQLCDFAKFNKRDGVRLCHFILEEKEWELLEQLNPLLELFLTAMKEISESGTPLVHEVILFMDILSVALDDWARNETHALAVCMAALRGLDIMNKYYSCADKSIVY
ncbi:hypothetical protein JAAARDRAFT_43260 [Jaapia argillacea MUCL 33604]|uniref:DUF659 domain-containing protein n=1 Tax=Jaapia argillacea MUCL 33604 TaxID=933084 RepID=A0A067QKK3_9AGAM|nr:hypothetical protein JAAARDRAFT_43260 [Jaapia argillacea MUCL 33604]